jgi:superfamily I DNA/RNA helicase
VRGRSFTLTVNYRTSHQIRRMADKLLPTAARDVDGNADERDRTLSVFNGPPPEIRQFDTDQAEIAALSGRIIQAKAEGTLPAEIGLFVRTHAQLSRARAAVEAAALPWRELSEREQEAEGHVLMAPCIWPRAWNSRLLR